jgi:hypothetical protein
MRRLLALGAIAAAGAAAYALAIRPWHLRWGARDNELTRAMPGDEIIPDADCETTRAVTVVAGPEHIWPWLAQMGWGRGGLYSYDFLDILFGILDRPSAQSILPQWQDLKTGDVIPLRRGGNFLVRSAKADDHLVMGPEDTSIPITWATAFYPEGEGRTRMVTRVRQRRQPGAGEAAMFYGMDLAAFIMVRRWLLNLKERAERLYAEERHRAERSRPSPACQPVKADPRDVYRAIARAATTGSGCAPSLTE